MEEKFKDLFVRRVHLEADYADVVSWYKAHGWAPPAKDLLPRIGFIAQDMERKIAVAWILQTDTRATVMKWVMMNPDGDTDLRREGLNRVVERCMREARELGYRVCYVTAQSAPMIGKFKKLGFRIHEGMTSLMIRMLAMEV